ncbi:FAD:protein FMN transferase [Arthrobacter sp. B1805]|uniref:FAD:protein FMN transferase n=1 Tax=Arthrobacter sp. B1805 TaxID=2058892 RepID=UPI000CE4A299|nr:FAD:protein FMN transferase [Arthrobacter sp. B1805]
MYSVTFPAIGTTVGVHATNQSVLESAVTSVRDYLTRLDDAVSRFRLNSELSEVNRRAASGSVALAVSGLFAEVVGAALVTAELTGGLVDPTIGSALIRSGYDIDLSAATVRLDWMMLDKPVPAPGWKLIHVDPRSGVVGVPQGMVLDFGASAKAHAADRLAELLARTLPGGFLVDLGGDIAVSGNPPQGGWQVGVEQADGRIGQVVTIHHQALATSSTQLRTWIRNGERIHHILDPRTGDTAPSVWAEATCAGATAVEANAASTAAVILGEEAPEWLHFNGISARLRRLNGEVVRTGGWPADEEDLSGGVAEVLI